MLYACAESYECTWSEMNSWPPPFLDYAATLLSSDGDTARGGRVVIFVPGHASRAECVRHGLEPATPAPVLQQILLLASEGEQQTPAAVALHCQVRSTLAANLLILRAIL